MASRRIDIDEIRELVAVRDGDPTAVSFTEYAERPCAFAAEVIGIALTELQRAELDAIASNMRFAVACGQRTGRTTVFAVALLWWCATKPKARAVLSTPSHGHMRATIWRQVGELIRDAHARLGATWYESPSRGVHFENGNEIIGVASDTGERLQGYAAQNLLIIVDEAAGYPENLMPSLMSNLAGGGQCTMGGNPTNNTSYFAKRWSTKGWVTMHISALDVAQSADRQPGQATPEWCAEQLEEHGVESLLYRARVLGQFSAANANGVFTLTELEDAQRRYDELMRTEGRVAFENDGPLEIGLDVARTGVDSTVAVARRGRIALAPQIWKIPDLVAVADRVAAYAQELRSTKERSVLIRVDGVGIGAGVVDILRRKSQLQIVEVQAAGTPTRDAYTNVRSESAFVCRDWVRAGGCIATHSRLEGEMAALQYAFDQRNRLKILSKDELRKQLGRSTDCFDALALATYDVTTPGDPSALRSFSITRDDRETLRDAGRESGRRWNGI